MAIARNLKKHFTRRCDFFYEAGGAFLSETFYYSLDYVGAIAVEREWHNVSQNIGQKEVFFLLGSRQMNEFLDGVSATRVLAHADELLGAKRC